MTDKNLAKALLNLGVGEISRKELQDQTQRIIARDRLWIKALVAVTSLLWIASIGTLYWFMPDLIDTYAQLQKAGGGEADPLIRSIYHFLLVLAGSVEALIFAMLSTFVLMYVLRRSTLRQINANLVTLSRQLEDLGRKQ
jgi:hypothetical protein